MTTVYLANGGNTSSTSPPGLTASGDVTVGGAGQTVVVDSGDINLSGGPDTFLGNLQVNSNADVVANSQTIASQNLANLTNNGYISLLSGTFYPIGHSGSVYFSPELIDVKFGDGTGNFTNNGRFGVAGKILGANFNFNGFHNTNVFTIAPYGDGYSWVQFQTGAGGFSNSAGGVISFSSQESTSNHTVFDLSSTVAAPAENDGTINVQGVTLGFENGVSGTHGAINLMQNAYVALGQTWGQPGTGTGQTINFSGGGNTLNIPAMPSGSTFPGLIRGFGQKGDVLETNTQEGVANTPPTYDTTTGILDDPRGERNKL